MRLHVRCEKPGAGILLCWPLTCPPMIPNTHWKCWTEMIHLVIMSILSLNKQAESVATQQGSCRRLTGMLILP